MGQGQQIAVIGAGLMGHGIALTLARAGHDVAITDPSEEMLSSAPDRIAESLKALGADEGDVAETLMRVTLSRGTADAVEGAAFVFEAAPEKLPLKQAIFPTSKRMPLMTPFLPRTRRSFRSPRSCTG